MRGRIAFIDGHVLIDYDILGCINILRIIDIRRNSNWFIDTNCLRCIDIICDVHVVVNGHRLVDIDLAIQRDIFVCIDVVQDGDRFVDLNIIVDSGVSDVDSATKAALPTNRSLARCCLEVRELGHACVGHASRLSHKRGICQGNS